MSDDHSVFDEDIDIIDGELLDPNFEEEEEDAFSPSDDKPTFTKLNNLDTNDSESKELEEEYPLASSTDLVPSGQSFSHYINNVNNAPILTSEQEWELAKKLREENDLDAAQKLIFSNLRHVISIARSYSGYGLSLPDLVQEGNVGLMKAVKRYDPEKKVKLMTFATHWVRAEINEYVIKNWQIVKMATTKAQRKLFFKLRSSHSRIGWIQTHEAKKIASDLNVQSADVYQMEERFTNLDTPFDLPVGESSESDFSPAQYLPDYRFSPEQIVTNEDISSFQNMHLAQGLEELDERSRNIIEDRWFTDEKMTLRELSKKYNVSIERIRQLETKAMETLRKHLEKERK